jgi:type IV pilus assembly protein PilW
MVAMGLGLLLVYAFFNVYASSRTAMRRVEQLGSIQQAVRTAFEYLSSDAHAVGMRGCFTGNTAPGRNNLTALGVTLANNYALPVEGYNAAAAPSYPIATSNTATDWDTNIGAGGVVTIPFATLGTSLAQGSDVVVFRTTVGRPLRLMADVNTITTPNSVSIESVAGGGRCTTDPSVAQVSGLCANSHALIANCLQARYVQVASIVNAGASSTITLGGGGLREGTGDNNYMQANSEVFPVQTVVYYVRPSARGNTQSLYRRIFDGDDGVAGTGVEEELIEDVENLQVTYGMDDPLTTNADGSPDLIVVNYVNANAITNWNNVLTVRMSLLVRGRDPVGADITLPASAPVNGVTITFPTTGQKFDRRVFTTTVALRNQVAF